MRTHLVLLGAVVLASCAKSPPEETTKPDTTNVTVTTATNQIAIGIPPSSGASSGAAPASSGGAPQAREVTWQPPAKWQQMPNTSQMRKATYKIPKAAGDADDGEMSVIAATGGVDANVKRWAGQFGGATPKTSPRSPAGLKVTFVEMSGTFSGGMPGMGGGGAPKDKYMLLGAIVDLGDEQWFFKATGPEKTMTAARPDFEALVASFNAR